MKQKLFITVLFLLGTLFIKAQQTGGGSDYSNNTKVKKHSKNSLYIVFIRTNARGNYKDNILTANDVMLGKGGMRKGIGFNLGTIYNIANITDMLNIGLDATYISYSYCKQNTTSTASFFATNFISSKLGPIFSISPADRFHIDAKVSLQPTFVVHNSLHRTSLGDIGVVGIDFAFRSGLGINLRYKPFLLGLEYSYGKTNVNVVYGGTTTQTKMSTNRLDFVLGFAF